MGKLAGLHVGPFVVGPVARGGILGAVTARIATGLGAAKQRARTHVIQASQDLANAFDTLARLLDDL